MPIDPTALQILSYPAGVLRRKASPVGEVTDEVRAVAARMIELMHGAPGIGLAAPQVGLSWRLFVVDVPPFEEEGVTLDDDPATCTAEPEVYIDPEIVGYSRDLEAFDEGCLSLPGITGAVRRPSVVTMQATGLDGVRRTMTATGLLGRCWQHEYDHLIGVLIIDKFSELDRRRAKSALQAMEAAVHDGR